MKTKYLIVAVLLLIMAAQWAVPARIIYRKSNVLNKGKIFKFKTEPIDPSDPFRGRSVHLNFEERSFEFDSSKEFNMGQKIYVTIKEGSDGYAHITAVEKKKPASSDFVIATVNYISRDDNKDMVYISYPFEEYYMEESKAPKTERLFVRSEMDTTLPAYASIAVLKGDAAIKDLIIDGKPVSIMLKEKESKK